MKVLLNDFWTGETGILLAGAVVDDSNAEDPRYRSLTLAKAPLHSYTAATFDPVIAAYRAQRNRLPNGSSLSLGDMLRAQGLIT